MQINLYSKESSITLQLNWLHQFQFAGFYMAIEKGFYKEKGLHVNIIEFNNNQTMNNVTQRKIDFAIGNSSLIIDSYSNAQIAILMPIFQSSPSILITTNQKIKTLKDFRNKKIMITDDELNSISTTAMLRTSGLTKDDYKTVPHSFDLNDLIEKKIDAMASYISNEPYLLNKKNIYFKIFNPKDFNFDFYGDILYTSHNLIKTNPILVSEFYNASKKGWIYAFEHIEESAQIIYEKYNTQNKTLEHLIFEGNELKKLAFDKDKKFGKFNLQKINKIIDIYKLFNVLPPNYKLTNLIDPMGLTKKHVHMGILPRRNNDKAISKWEKTMEYLNKQNPNYFFHAVQLSYENIENAIKNKEIDYVLTDTMSYIKFEDKYSVEKILTLENLDLYTNKSIKRLGSVIFTKSNRNDINALKDIQNKRFGAVHKNSFGGWVIAQKELYDNRIILNTKNISFLKTAENVVYNVLNKKIDVGTIRTDILEKMSIENKINLKDIKILSPKKYDNFPYLVSTQLYPEWPLSKLKDSSEELSLKIIKSLLTLKHGSKINQEAQIYGWTIPINYAKVNHLLNELQLPPYNGKKLTFKSFYKKYQIQFVIVTFLFILVFAGLIYTKKMNNYLKEFNKQLEQKVQERTEELSQINIKLKHLANTDELTKISNRRNLFKKIAQYIKIAKRNQTPLFYASLDIDFFKNVNDTYGHLVGDEVLKHFTNTVQKNLRESDIFGRVGGEEFGICLQNTSWKGAKIITDKIKYTIEKNPYIDKNNNKIYITVSIGVAKYDIKFSMSDLIFTADNALYKAKEKGRNQVVFYN
ncbi:diguanylate cyclase [Sulfurospirillum arcachonense]|uniref:diguanylate cyclase n=1 Tax=Sulfurospirillum arcachonense TaxID=57666 RepID=UPI00146FB049|nr:diguanylate cyclase [Sulfurospirillum arcachonense]